MAKRMLPAVRGKSKGSTLSLLVILFVAGLLGLSMFRQQVPEVRAVQAGPVVGQFDTVKIPVPKSPVPAGTRIQDIRFELIDYPRHQVPKGAVRDVTPLLNAVVVAPLPAKLPLFQQNVSRTAGASNPVIEGIPEGMRAMTIRVDETSAVEGWAGTGAVVDVLLTTKSETTVVAEKVKILSAERSVTPVSASSPNVPGTVTLLVSQEQCLAINSAVNNGKISFALRSNTDEGNWDKTNYQAAWLKRGSEIAKPKANLKGYIKIGGEAEASEQYVLTDGKWVKSGVPLTGFSVDGEG